MARLSAGILMYKRHGDTLQVLLGHPGGPYWRNRDAGAWMIPKGEMGDDETPEAAARREFEEELGVAVTGVLQPLGRVRQRGGKEVEAFAIEGDFDISKLRSNTFELEWPPHGGRRVPFPEIDRAEWLALPVARRKILPSQMPLLDRLETILRRATGGG
jgi:predicted NUDIX family NTP pyrophosphohydrolase